MSTETIVNVLRRNMASIDRGGERYTRTSTFQESQIFRFDGGNIRYIVISVLQKFYLVSLTGGVPVDFPAERVQDEKLRGRNYRFPKWLLGLGPERVTGNIQLNLRE